MSADLPLSPSCNQTLWIGILPHKTAMRILDNFLHDGTKFVLRVAAAVVKLIWQELQTVSADEQESTLHSLLSSKPYKTKPSIRAVFDRIGDDKRLFSATAKISLSSTLARKIDMVAHEASMNAAIAEGDTRLEERVQRDLLEDPFAGAIRAGTTPSSPISHMESPGRSRRRTEVDRRSFDRERSDSSAAGRVPIMAIAELEALLR